MKKASMLIILVAVSLIVAAGTVGAQTLTPKEELGKVIFFDKSLSLRDNQACASCHAPTVGWTGANPGINLRGAVYPGSIKTEFGNRKPPAAAYATTSPLFNYDPGGDLFFGGNFWNGRATGWDLGNPAADQARGPFLNPVEQALPDKAAVVDGVCSSRYAKLFQDVWGDDACNDVDTAYNNIALSIAAYEGSNEVNQYSSKYDAVKAGLAAFTAQELKGESLFLNEGKCAACHVVDAGPDGPPLFTDYTFDNLGVPKNPLNPVYASNPGFVDNGLGDFLRVLAGDDAWRNAEYVTYNMKQLDSTALYSMADDNDGKHKVPTLRNVAKAPGPGFTKAFMHNGVFKSLKEVVRFYNKRNEMIQQGLIVPEVSENMNIKELGNLGLTDAEEDAIVAFMETLSDGYFTPAP